MTFEEFRLAAENIATAWDSLDDACQELATALGWSTALQTTVQDWATNAATFATFSSNQLATVRSANTIPTVVSAVNAILQTAQPIVPSGSQTAVAYLTATEIVAFGVAAEPPPDGTSVLGQIYASTDSASIAAGGIVQARLLDLRDLFDRVLERLESIQSIPAGPAASLADIASNVGDLTTYPILTQETPPNWNSPGPGFSTMGTSSVGLMVENAISSVLGHRPRMADTKSFLTALTQSFKCTQVGGRAVCEWVERAAVGTTELGIALTGAQASIYERAKDALGRSLDQLRILTSLRSDEDVQEIDAARVIVETEFTQLVNELGLEGGPRAQRVDELFLLLIDPDTAPDGSARTQLGFELIDQPGVNILTVSDVLQDLGSGEVGRLGDTLGLMRTYVNTIAEEQNLTNFIVLRDHIESLYASWQEFRPNFVGGVSAFLGTQLVLLQRALSVVGESVGALTRAMDSVFFGRAERQTVQVKFPSDTAGQPVPPEMSVDQLLTWIHGYASEEAPRIIRDAGKRGIRTIVPTLNLLQRRIERGAIPHPAARHPRVRSQVEELSRQLSDASRYAQVVI